MVKLKSKEREQDLIKMLNMAKKTGRELPKIKEEYEYLQKKKLKGNLNLFRF